MTDPRREVDIDMFAGLGTVNDALSGANENDTVAELLREHEATETAALAVPVAPAPTRPPVIAGDEMTAKAREHLDVLIFRSSRPGEPPHVVTRTGEGPAIDATCRCKATTFNMPRGCWAMVFARVVWGLPAQEG